jgi:TonB family protein
VRIAAIQFAILLSCVASASALQRPTDQQLIDSAHVASGLSQLGSYVLRADVTISPAIKASIVSGKLTIWRDHERARIELELGPVHEIRVINGDMQYADPGSGALFLTGLKTFDQHWDPDHSRSAGTHQSDSASVKKGKVEGAETWCVEKKSDGTKHESCFDAATSVLLREKSGKENKTEYLDYTLGHPSYPQRVRIARENFSPLELSNIKVESTAIPDEKFQPPPNFLEVEGCKGIQHPTPLHTPDPSFPQLASKQRVEGKAVLYAMVSKEGRVVSAQILSADSYGFGAKSQDVMRDWAFKPATCGGHPVNFELAVEFSFNLKY